MKPKEPSGRGGSPPHCLRIAGIALILFSMSVLRLAAQTNPNYPAWWTTYGVLNGNPPNDFAGVTQGQAKNFALAAIYELDNDLAQFGGSGLDSLAAQLLSGPTAHTDDYIALNIGTLKALVKPFYDRLMAVGYYGPPLTITGTSPVTTGTYPWVGSNRIPNDYALAVIGQLKYAFSFDVTHSSGGTGIPDWWVLEYYPSGSTFGGVLGVDPNAIAPMGYGITNLQAYQLGLNPNDPYNGATPSLTISGGNGQSAGNGIFLANPLVVTVTVSGSPAPANMPVSFQVGSAGGYLATSPGAPASSTLNVLTGTGGTASAWFACPTSGTGQTTINAFTGVSPRLASVQFTASITPPGPSVPAPSNVIARIMGGGSVFVCWTNNDNGTAAAYEVERSTDTQTWVSVVTISSTSQYIDQYTDTTAPSGGNLYYRINSIAAP
jgi:hypothetical protein